jgi:hypothetical protein
VAGGFLDGQADEVPQFDQFCLDRVLRGELIQGVVDRQKPFVSVWRSEVRLIEIDPLMSATMTHSEFAASPVNEDAPHRLSGGRKKMSASAKLWVVTAHQSQPGLVH